MAYYNRRKNHQTKRCRGKKTKLVVLSYFYIIPGKSVFVTVETNFLFKGLSLFPLELLRHQDKGEEQCVHRVVPFIIQMNQTP